MVIDDKGGEVMHKYSKKMTKGENFDIKGLIKILSTQVGEEAHKLD